MGLLTESSPVAGPVCTGAFTGRLWPARAEDGGQATLTHSGVRGTDPGGPGDLPRALSLQGTLEGLWEKWAGLSQRSETTATCRLLL